MAVGFTNPNTISFARLPGIQVARKFERFDNGFQASSIPGNTVWLRSDAGVTQAGNIVSAWADQSGSNNNATQSNAANRPTFDPDDLNGLPCINFDGVDDFLEANGVAATFNATDAPFTCFIVAKINALPASIGTLCSAGSNASLTPFNRIGIRNSSGGRMFSTRTDSVAASNSATSNLFSSIADPLLLTYSCSGTDLDFYINGTADLANIAFDVGAITQNLFTIGCRRRITTNDEFANFCLGEIIIYNRELNATERNQIHTYLITKYGIIGASSSNFDFNLIPDLLAWYRADAGITTIGNKVVAWADQTPNLHDATQPTFIREPDYESSSFNGLPCVKFDGNLDCMQADTASTHFNQEDAPFTLVAAVDILNFPPAMQVPFFSTGRNLNPFNDYALYGYNNNRAMYDERNILLFPATATGATNFLSPGAAVVTQSCPGTAISYFRNGIQDGAAKAFNSSLAAQDLFTLGALRRSLLIFSRFAELRMAEFLLFKRELSTEERVFAENTLRQKYGI